MKYVIDNEKLKERSIYIEDEIMPNKEERFRIKLKDYSGVNITTASETPCWQNAHFHKYCKEIYIVLSGKILIAIKKNDIVKYITLNKGEELIIEPTVEHNVYMYKTARTIVIKYGDTRESDWNEAKELDTLTKSYEVE